MIFPILYNKNRNPNQEICDTIGMFGTFVLIINVSNISSEFKGVFFQLLFVHKKGNFLMSQDNAQLNVFQVI